MKLTQDTTNQTRILHRSASWFHIVDVRTSKQEWTDKGFRPKLLLSCQERYLPRLDKDEGDLVTLWELIIPRQNIKTAVMTFVVSDSYQFPSGKENKGEK